MLCYRSSDALEVMPTAAVRVAAASLAVAAAVELVAQMPCR